MRNFYADCLRVVSIFVISAAFTLTAFAQDFSGEPKNDSTETSVTNAAQAKSDDYGLDKKNAFSVWGAFAPESLRAYGGSRRSRFGEIGIRYSRRIATTENLAFKYQVDFIPVALIKYERELLTPGVTPGSTAAVERRNQTAYAYGFTPVNLQLNFRRRTKIQPFVTLEGGMLFFDKKIPDDRSVLRPNQVGRRFNFALAGGGGVEFLTREARSYIVGFKFHHISNNSTGNINPGFDQSLFYFGYTFKKW